MLELYDVHDANRPRLKTDKYFIDFENGFKFCEITDKTAHFIEKNQLLDENLWTDFAERFKVRDDSDDNGWRGEFWGKLMRGGCLVYAYTKNSKLLDVLTSAVEQLLQTQDEFGRISTYSIEKEFNGWDIWCRKYVLLGLQYFLEINENRELEQKIIDSMCRQVDYLISKIGLPEQGKILITSASKHWYGLNSSSILEPIVRLYSITDKQKYLDFAQYIADCGATYVDNIFRLAEKKQLRIHQYPVTKAYEMTSCFEGLLELYRVTGTTWYKTACINFADLILEDELTVIGCVGCTHELFDHASVRQANTNLNSMMQETCVTVTLMKFFLQLNLLTGNSKYIDAFEISYYNAYLGAVNTDKSISRSIKNDPSLEPKFLPFDSYSPLTVGTR